MVWSRRRQQAGRLKPQKLLQSMGRIIIANLFASGSHVWPADMWQGGGLLERCQQGLGVTLHSQPHPAQLHTPSQTPPPPLPPSASCPPGSFE